MSDERERAAERTRADTVVRRAEAAERTEARETDRIGREAQRRAVAYARARGQL